MSGRDHTFSLALPVDGTRSAPRRYAEVEIGRDERPPHWWVALFLAFLHRHTGVEHLHLLGATADDGNVAVHGFAVLATDTLAGLAARVRAALPAPIARTRPAPGARILAGLPSSGDQADLRLDLAGGRAALVADETLWGRPTLTRLAAQLTAMSRLGDDTTPIGELPMVDPASPSPGWNDTAMTWPEGTYLDLFTARAAAVPSAPAIVEGDRVTTFADLAAAVAAPKGSGDRLGLAAGGIAAAKELNGEALANLTHWIGATYEVGPGDRAAWLGAADDPGQAAEWMPYLALGAAVHVGDTVGRTPEQVRDWLLDSGITHATVGAALARRLWALPWPESTPLRVMVTPAEHLHQGPPEGLPFQVVTVHDSLAHVGAKPGTVLAGTPIANTRAYVLDTAGAEVPPGVIGHLRLAGPAETPRATGDLARRHQDGAVELLGRADSQVKVRGYRVLPAEAERVVAGLPGVEAAVVTASAEGELIAYVAGADQVTAEQVRADAGERLPYWMVPGTVVVMAELPERPGGEVDRAALRPPGESPRAGLTSEYVEPSGAVEKELATLWAQFLNVGTVGARDNFFELGGYSVIAVRLMSATAEAFEVELVLADLYEHPTVTALAAHIDALRKGR
uniref:PyrK2 n=1 Tax=Streptomyces rugosporus TaxID=295838 RepID=K7R6H1_STRRG|nr:PyrK2 [Streptomyces rugosporus]